MSVIHSDNEKIAALGLEGHIINLHQTHKRAMHTDSLELQHKNGE